MSTNAKPFSLYENLPSQTVRLIHHVGIKRVIKPRCHFTSLERRYYAMLKALKIFYVPQYPLDGRFFDAYLPDYNVLLEFDGSFWHPATLGDCKYDCQKKNYSVDRLKNNIANENGHIIVRIREDVPIEAGELRKILEESKLWA